MMNPNCEMNLKNLIFLMLYRTMMTVRPIPTIIRWSLMMSNRVVRC